MLPRTLRSVRWASTSALRKPLTVNKTLPDPLADRRKNRLYFGCFAVIMGVSLFGIVNYERSSSPVLNSTMYFLRRSKVARDALGSKITFAGLFPFVRGDLNTMRGIVDVSVKVQGSDREGTMVLKASRDHRLQQFQITEWSLIMEGNNPINLLKDESVSLLF